MEATNTTNGQRSGRFIESLQDSAPQVVPTLSKSGNEDEESRRKRVARQHLQKAREALARKQGSVLGDGAHEDVETSDPVTSELPQVSTDEPVHFVAELATVSHQDLDHPMPNYEPELGSADTSVSKGPQSIINNDVIMEDAPPLLELEGTSVDTSVPEGLESIDDDVVMEDAPPLQQGE